mgnify:CR=1 FL=1
MPLDKSCSLDALQKNISRSYKEGKKAKGTQHVAIGLSVLKRACGVSDDSKMTPKEIVAAGQKGEGVVYRLSGLMERGVGPPSAAVSGVDPEVEWHKWVSDLADDAGMALKEAGRWRRGPATEKLLKTLSDFTSRRIEVPTFEEGVRNPGARKWAGWLGRLEMAARNESVPALTGALVEYRNGQVAIPGAARKSFGTMMERLVRAR